MTVKPHPARCPTCRKIRAAHKAGTTGRNEIAKQLGIALATVTAHAKHCGITFDRAATKVAVEAQQLDNRARRVRAIGDLFDIVERDIARVKAPTYTYRVLFKDYSEQVTDQAVPSADGRNHASTIAQHLATITKLEQVDASTNTAASHSLLDTLANGFAAAAAGYTPPESP